MFRLIFTIVFGLFSFHSLTANEKFEEQKKIGLCVVATGRYDKFAQEMIDSARVHFCKNHQVTFFVFSDGSIKESPDVVQIHQKRLGWPHDTMKRFEIYDKNRDKLDQMDYLFAVDADMLFVAPIGDEVLSDLVGTQHPGFVGKKGSYEKNKLSRAYVHKKEKKIYFAGGFYGGKKEEFFKLVRKNKENIDADLAHGLIAVWHDESHLNRYFIDNPPSLVLSPSYCYPESWQIPYPKKLIALDKNHEEMRK